MQYFTKHQSKVLEQVCVCWCGFLFFLYIYIFYFFPVAALPNQKIGEMIYI